MVISSSRPIKSAHRVLEILEYFDQDRRNVTVMEMARTLNYPQSSTSELLRCLAQLGYLHYNRMRRTYSPTVRVALLGAWVKPSLFRGGPVLSAIDEVSRLTNQTVALSTGSNYALQHVHVSRGNSEDSIQAQAGDELPVLHCAQGRLLMSSYENDDIKLAVHRLNADEQESSRHVRMSDLLPAFAELRERGWVIEQDRDGVGCVAVLLSCGRIRERLILSVLAKPSDIAQRGQRILDLLLSRKNVIAGLHADEERGDAEASRVVPMLQPIKIASYRRHVA